MDSLAKLNPGDRVRWNRRNSVYFGDEGTVIRTHGQGSIDVQWDDQTPDEAEAESKFLIRSFMDKIEK